ncbi:MAG: response regulator [Bdellovibrionales bacterium]|nr:response regulator [Bdellovibrionales bacterium]
MLFDPPYKIIIIDDDAEILSIMSLIINKNYSESAIVHPFPTFKEGFDYISKNDVHVVFIDLNLLDEDGMKGIEKLKEMNKKYQIVAFSSDTDLSVKLACYNSGSDFFLEKPIDRNILNEVIDDALRTFIHWKKITKG